MIDSKLISIIELKGTIQYLDVYSNKILSQLFTFFYIINKNEFQYFIIEFIFKISYFLQFFFIGIIHIPLKVIKTDKLLNFIFKLKSLIFVHNLVNNKKRYIIALIFCYIFSIIIVLLVFFIFIKKQKTNKKLVVLYNYLNLFYINYFFCFQINIMLLITYCKDSKLNVLQIKCIKSIKHIILLICCSLNLILSISYIFIISKFIGTINNMKGKNIYSKSYSNYDIYSNIFCIICYIFGFVLEIYGKDYSILRIIIRMLLMFGCFFISLYLYQKVFFYDENMNILYFCGWTFSMWFYFSLLIKEILNLKELLLLVLFGWFLLGCFVFIHRKMLNEQLLISTNIFETKSIKDIELFTQNLYKLLKLESETNKFLLMGITNTFKDFFSDKPQLLENYEKFISNKYLIKKFGGKRNIIIETYGLIFVLLHSILDKLRNHALLVLCAFLINKLKNYNLAMYLCSKHKVLEYYNQYIKFSLIEDTREAMISTFEKNINLDNIKQIQIGSVIYYLKEVENLKLRIYDATCNQIDYFDSLKNNNNSNKNVLIFLQTGISIIKIRKEIFNLWNKIIHLNPFNEEIKRDYILYLKFVIQDEELAREEEKKFIRYKNFKLIEKDKIYYSLFEKDITSILLLDDNGNRGKIIYLTPNFFNLFNYHQKDLNTLTIHDLVPKYISLFHREIIQDTLKYSNLRKVFKKEKEFLLRGKNNEIYEVTGFFKLLSDLSHGAIYIGMIKKIKDKEFLIILDNEFKVDSMTTPFYNSDFGNNLLNKENYPFGLSNKIFGNHISIFIPSIIPLLKFKENKFIIQKINVDFKGVLYSNFKDINYFNKKIDSFLEKIKQGIKINYDLESKYSSSKNYNSPLFIKEKNIENKTGDFNELIDEYNKLCKNNFYYISYKITKHSFLNEKYCYYRIYIIKDIFSEFEIQEKRTSTTTKNQASSILLQTFNNEFKLEDIHKEKKIKILLEEKLRISSPKNKNKTKGNEEELIQSKEKNILEEKQPLKHSINSNNSQNTNYNIQFLNLKLKILNNETPYYIFLMRILILFFSSFTIFLITYNHISMKDTFKLLQNYLDQNYVFNHTKVAVLNLYYASTNIKLLKHNIIGNNGCIGQYFCVNNFTEIMFRAIENIKLNTDRVARFDEDYQNIIQKRKNLDLFANSLLNKTDYDGNIVDLLYLLLSEAKKLSENIQKYYNENEEYYKAYIESIIKYCEIYLQIEESDGLNDIEKRKKASQPKYSSNKLYMILNLIIFTFVFFSILILVHKFYKIECNLIIKMIRFHSKSFENYIKYLEDLKKKLKDETNEEDKSVNNFDTSNLNESIDENNNQIINIENNDKTIKEKPGKNKTLSQKKKIAKMSKMNLQKNEKIQIMKNHFFTYNIIFSLNICSLSILMMTYYIFVYSLYEKQKENFFQFDDFMCSVEGIYPQTYLAFATLKNQTLHFTNFIITKNKKLEELNSGIESITFQNKIYTKDNSSLLENEKYIFEIPNENERIISKLGNLITSLTSNIDTSNNNSKTILIKLYNGDACDILFNIYFIDNIKYYKCINFWSSFISQGIEQCLAQLEIEMLNIISYLKYLNNSTESYNNLMILENIFADCEEFIMVYFYYSYKVTQLILIDLENDKSNFVLFLFDFIVYSFIVICIILFFILNIFVYYDGLKFGQLINFIVIFPIQYLIEEENLYNEIIDLYKKLYR